MTRAIRLHYLGDKKTNIEGWFVVSQVKIYRQCRLGYQQEYDIHLGPEAYVLNERPLRLTAKIIIKSNSLLKNV